MTYRVTFKDSIGYNQKLVEADNKDDAVKYVSQFGKVIDVEIIK